MTFTRLVLMRTCHATATHIAPISWTDFAFFILTAVGAPHLQKRKQIQPLLIGGMIFERPQIPYSTRDLVQNISFDLHEAENLI